jgi:predicted ATPase/DNA-binding SARP family transcriptional activator
VDALEFRILGPFEVRRGDQLLAGGGGKRRGLLAVLLLSANKAVSVDRLSAALWGDDAPRSATNLIQGYVSDWRSLLDPERASRSSGHRLLSTPSGYQLSVAEDECDLLRFTVLAREGQQAVDRGDLLTARRLLRGALEQRRGPALADFGDENLAGATTSLEEAWLATVERAADVELALGRPDLALAYLEEPAASHPLRERLAELRMLALYRAGRQSDALAVYEEARTALCDALGIDPSPRLSQLYVGVLRQEPSLQGPSSAGRPSSTLPARLSSFIGREQDLAAVVELVGTHRLVTLTGPGGSGKTRLAVEAAAAMALSAERDISFIDLTPVRDGDLLWSAVASGLGLQLAGNLDAPLALAAQLGRRPALLILDNMEQLTGAAPDIARVLSLAPQVAILATSREPLGVVGEQLFPVAPLPLPSQDVESDVPAVLNAAAVRLFVDRARAVDPAFAIADSDAWVAAGICRRLDGLPLALELAAPWTKTLSLRALLERLDQPLSLLVEGGRTTDRPDRHRTLRAAIEWSYTTLTAPQQRLLDYLSLFVSGARLDALQSVADLGDDTLATLAALVDKNLVRRTETPSEPRYRLLETIREYASEQLHARQADHGAAQDRYVDYFCGLAEQAARSAGTPAGEARALRLNAEQDEIRAVLEHLEDVGPSARVLTFVVDCLPLWWDLGHIREGYTRVVSALRACGADASTELLAAGNIVAAMLGEGTGEPLAALELSRTGTALAQQAGSLPLEGLGRCLQGNTLSWMDWSGPATDGLAMLEAARDLGSRLPMTGLRWGWANRHSVLAWASLAMVDVLRYRDPPRAHVLVSTSWDDAARRDSNTASFVLRAIGFLAADAGRWAEAEEHLTESLELATRLGLRRSESRSAEELALLSWARGDLAAAAEYGTRAVQLSIEVGHAINWVRCAAVLADIAMERGEMDSARRLLAEAETAVQQGYPALAVRMVLPRRARFARLSGNAEEAISHLGAASVLEHADGLTPHRIVFLIELAYAAASQGDRERLTQVTGRLARDATRIGLRLPQPEVRHLEALVATLAIA